MNFNKDLWEKAEPKEFGKFETLDQEDMKLLFLMQESIQVSLAAIQV